MDFCLLSSLLSEGVSQSQQNLLFLAFSFKIEALSLATYYNLLQGFPSNLQFKKKDSNWSRGNERGRGMGKETTASPLGREDKQVICS